MIHISERWRETAEELSWQIAYRSKSNGSLLSDPTTPFELFDLPDGQWGADPFLFEQDGQLCLFYELYLEKQKKGVIAVSKWEGNNFSQPETVIEEPFHLSFPCVFKIGESVYMIPETGTQNKIILYECTEFPYKWQQKKVLADVMAPSDIIVFEQNREFYVLASILKGSPSSAQNYLYRLDTQNLTLELCTKQEDFGEGGFRNAGLLFEDNGRLVRPGQNCPQNSYGKSLYFWEPIKIDSEKYEESFITELTRNDITVNGTFDGIHTYNKLNDFDVIDLRITHKNNIFKRIKLFGGICLKYVKNHA